MKIKYLFFTFILIVLFFLNSGLVSALEVTYPSLPLLNAPTGASSFPEYIAYWIGLLVYVAGILSLISFVIGAVGLISPNIESHNNAKDRMKGAILGLVLTITSVLILKTINPVFLAPSFPPMQRLAGIYYYNPATQEKRSVSNMVLDNFHSQPEGFNQIIYCCNDNCDGGEGPALLIWKFAGTELEANRNNNLNEVIVRRKTCGQTEDINGFGSFTMTFETPGVYFCYSTAGCSGDMCQGYMSHAYVGDQDQIGAPFAGHITGVRFVGNYGVIFHEAKGLKNSGKCGLPITTSSNNYNCMPVPNSSLTNAANIFKINSDPLSSGDGVYFYSEPFGQVSDYTAGFYPLETTSPVENYTGTPVSTQTITSNLANDVWQAGNMCYSYRGTLEPNNYIYRCGEGAATSTCYDLTPNNGIPDIPLGDDGMITEGVDCSRAGCETFQNCHRSMFIKGNFLVALYSVSNSNPNLQYCQTFTKTIDNLQTEPISVSPNTILTDVYVLPTKQ